MSHTCLREYKDDKSKEYFGKQKQSELLGVERGVTMSPLKQQRRHQPDKTQLSAWDKD